MFKVGDKVRVVNGTDIEGVITLKANNHGLCSSAIYPFPTVNIDRGNGEIWKVNLDDIGLVDEEKEKELELWQSAKKRYLRIHEVLGELIIELKNGGNDRLDIPKCDFCDKYNTPFQGCNAECPWRQVIGNGTVCGEPAQKSSWREVYDHVGDAKSAVSSILRKIDDQITGMERKNFNEV